MLGMIIGVGAVISLMSVGQGAQAPGHRARSEAWAPTCCSFGPARTQQGGVRTAQGSAPTLTAEDATRSPTSVIR